MTEHVEESDLPALLTGGLGRNRTADVVAHLHQCDGCRRDLVATAAASGVLQMAARELPREADHSGADHSASVATTNVPPLARQRRRPVSRQRLIAAAAAVAVALTAGGLAQLRDSGGAEPGTAAAALTSPTGGDARGVVTMRRPGGRTDMTLSTVGLSAPGPGQFYEVWLLDTTTSKMVGLGVLGPDGRSDFRIPDGLIAAYQAIDVSLQRDNGDPRHSATSVLRGRYS